MKKETFDKAAELDSEILLLTHRLNNAKKTKRIVFCEADKDQIGTGLITIYGTVNQCTGQDDVALFKKLQGIVIRSLQEDLRKMQLAFDKIK